MLMRIEKWDIGIGLFYRAGAHHTYPCATTLRFATSLPQIQYVAAYSIFSHLSEGLALVSAVQSLSERLLPH